jgi:hypothetical protein
MNAEAARVSQLVSQKLDDYLKQHPHGKATLQVFPEGIRKRNNWWQVPVVASSDLAASSAYYFVLAEVEEDLDAVEGENILLVPHYPEDPSPNSSNGAIVN